MTNSNLSPADLAKLEKITAKVRLSDNTALIKAVMQKGTAAIEDFIGHKLSGQESPRRIEYQLKFALIRMSDDAVQIYRDKYFK